MLGPTFIPYSAFAATPTTPIQHVIIVVGENHTFDNVFGTYQASDGQTVDNLLSKRIVKADGTLGQSFGLAAQKHALVKGQYKSNTNSVGIYAVLPPDLKSPI